MQISSLVPRPFVLGTWLCTWL